MTWPYEFSVGDLMRRAAETPSEVAKRERLAELSERRDTEREAIGRLSPAVAELYPGRQRFSPRIPQPLP